MMLNILTVISDLIAPPHPSVFSLRQEKPEQFIRFFTPLILKEVVALARFEEILIHNAITANKFYNYKPAAKLLASLLNHWLNSLPSKSTYLVSIPLSKKRLAKRGYNQVERILKAITVTQVSLLPLLIRSRDTKPQTSLKRKERLTNLVNAFTVDEKIISQISFSGCRVIICDDVVTTGATLCSAKKVLSHHLPKDCEILCVAIAH